MGRINGYVLLAAEERLDLVQKGTDDALAGGTSKTTGGTGGCAAEETAAVKSVLSTSSSALSLHAIVKSTLDDSLLATEETLDLVQKVADDGRGSTASDRTTNPAAGALERERASREVRVLECADFGDERGFDLSFLLGGEAGDRGCDVGDVACGDFSVRGDSVISNGICKDSGD